MRVPPALLGLVDAALARTLRSWDDLKRSHPGLSRRLVPFARSLWLLAIRRRPAWAQMRDRQADPVALNLGGRSHVGGQGVDEQHVIEDRAVLVAARVEHAFLVPDVGVFLVGWLFDPGARVTSLVVKAGATSSENVLAELLRLPRGDVNEAYRSWAWGAGRLKHGFAGLVRLEAASVGQVLKSLTVELAGGEHIWHLAPRPIIHEPGSPLRVIHDILALVPPRIPEVLRRHLGPTVSALWRPTEGSVEVVDIGRRPVEPRVSIVIPVYGRYDLIEHQLALFSGDPDMREAEIVYVIDDPTISEEATRLCRELEPLFRVPCRVVICDQNNGFARATNIGARLARAPLLLLLNSDVLPAAHGWLSSLLETYAELPSPGALGPRLLFPDGMLQHDGMAFVQAAWFPGIWLNDHPGKGLPPPAASPGVPRRVPAITAAAMLISRELYQEVGGLDEGYIVGDFEDSDLCLKLAELGRGCFVAPWIELYHLERQSLGLGGDAQWRQSLTLYNAWRHTSRWDVALERAAREPVHA